MSAREAEARGRCCAKPRGSREEREKESSTTGGRPLPAEGGTHTPWCAHTEALCLPGRPAGRRQGQKLQRVRCQLKTTGGDCSRLVATSLGELLARAGLNPFIYFDRDEFQPNSESGE